MSRTLLVRLSGILLALASLTTLYAAGSSVSGTVVSRQGDRVVPIFRATVTAREAGGSQPIAVVKTDQQGRFLMVDLPSPRLQLSATKNGFYLRTINGHENQQIVLDCTRADDCNSVTFDMGPAAAIMGMVVDEMGQPLDNVRVIASTGNIPSNRDRGWGPFGRETDDRGYFRIAGLKPGHYNVKAQGERRRMGPAVSFESEQMEVDVAEGAEVNGVRLDVRLSKPAKTYSISGKVTGVELASDDGFQSIQLRNLEGAANRFRGRFGMGNRVASDGSFKLEGVTPGRYSVSYYFAPPDRRPGMDFNLRPMGIIDVSGNMSGLVLSPVPATGFTGVLKFEMRAVPKEVRLFITTDGDYSATVTATAPDYRVRADHLPGGKHNIHIMNFTRGGRPDFYIRSIRRGDDLLPPKDLEISEGSVEDFEILLSDEMARVSGRVKLPSDASTGQPIVKAAQYQVALAAPDERIDIVQADQFGRFHFDDLIPGDYKICAWENADSQTIHDDKTWEKAGAAVRRFSVDAGNEIEIELTAVP